MRAGAGYDFPGGRANVSKYMALEATESSWRSGR
jgi:hypothetical protein